MKKMFGKKQRFSKGTKIGAAVFAVALITAATINSGAIRNLHGDELISFDGAPSQIAPAAGDEVMLEPINAPAPINVPEPAVNSADAIIAPPEPISAPESSINSADPVNAPEPEMMDGEPGVSQGWGGSAFGDDDFDSDDDVYQGEVPVDKITTCGSYPDWIGNEVDEEAVKATGKPYRILKPDSMATMDHSPDRINVMVDENNIVLDVRCG